MEHALLATFIGTSVYMLIGSYEFQPAGGMFPRFTSAVVIALGLLLVFRAYLPPWLQRVVVDDGGMFDVEDISETADDDAAIAGSRTDDADIKPSADGTDVEEPPAGDVTSRGSLITGGLCVAYLLASYAVGMLWATPLFVVIYTVWTGQRWAAVIGLTLLSFVLAYLFYDVLNLDIASGWIHEWLIAEVL